MSLDARQDDQGDGVPVALEIVRGDATEEELAALIAVLSDAHAAETAAAVAAPLRASAWERTQRPMRTTLRRDIPWGRFSG